MGLLEAVATRIVRLQKDAKVTTLSPRFRFRATYLVVRTFNLETKKNCLPSRFSNTALPVRNGKEGIHFQMVSILQRHKISSREFSLHTFYA